MDTFIKDNAVLITCILLLANAGLLSGFILLFLRINRLQNAYSKLTTGTSGGNIEEILFGHLASVSNVSQRMERLESVVKMQGNIQQTCLQRVGVVRYNAFEDVGGEQSFSLVVLDGHKNGIAISSVYSRMDVRVYAKAIRSGQTSHPLTHEEQLAMQQALGTP